MIVDKIKKREPSAKRNVNRVDIQVGKWVKCTKCKEILYKEDVKNNANICPNCGAYFRMHINRRLESIIDEGTYKRFDLNIENCNPLGLEDYPTKLERLRQSQNLIDKEDYRMEETRTIIVDKYDYKLMLNALNEFRNAKLQQNIDTEIIDKLIINLLNAPKNKKTLSLSKNIRGKYTVEAR